eukprot:CAMPEP_0173424842 /NCGR_PEP_ID=MMETSP1357-20121228/4691_1 /TAXON_ID=77926 /ORGANISM="Hemiselmis rufescens, Strain PCC563" /LENGTH=446 /DNA_ID=CAMNT_0014388171 /DNA_START=8 /DNA_END=1345 /DNA_ORIENTATION=+
MAGKGGGKGFNRMHKTFAMSNKELDLQLSLVKTREHAERCATPKFLQDPVGVMVVSPVSPDNPYTPMRFLREAREKHMSLICSPYHGKSRRGGARGPKAPSGDEGGIARFVDTPEKAHEERHRSNLKSISNKLAVADAEHARDLVHAASASLGRMLHGMLSGKEIFEWMSLDGKRRLFDALQRLRVLLWEFMKSVQMQEGAHPPKAEAFEYDSSTLVVKMAMLELQGGVDALGKASRLVDDMALTNPSRLAKADKAALRECQALTKEVDALLDGAAQLIPLAALKTLEGAKKDFGRKLMERIGVQGARIGELQLEEQVTSMFNDMDMDNNGVISSSELERHLSKLQIIVPHKDLEQWIRDVDFDGDGSIDLSEFVDFVRVILQANSVYVFKELTTYVERNGMSNRKKPPALMIDSQTMLSPARKAGQIPTDPRGERKHPADVLDTG